AGSQLRPEAMALLDRFDRAWHDNAVPRLDEFLSQFSSAPQGTEAEARRTFLEELIKIDLEYRWRRSLPEASADRGHGLKWRPLLEDYVEHCAELGPASRLPIALIVEEYRVRKEWGDDPAQADYLARFGPQASQLCAGLSQVDADLAAERARRQAAGRAN